MMDDLRWLVWPWHQAQELAYSDMRLFTTAHHLCSFPSPIKQHALDMSHRSFVIVLEPGGQRIRPLVLGDGLPE